MITYEFECDKESGGCGFIFECKSTMKEITNFKPDCPNCKNCNNIIRYYGSTYIFNSNVTLGSLADKNTAKMSQDCRDAMLLSQNKYRLKAFEGHLPDGAKRKEEV